MMHPNERRNEYDGEEEFWVTVKETGKKVESATYSEIHQKESEALLVPCTELMYFLLIITGFWIWKFRSVTRQKTILLSTLGLLASLGCWKRTRLGRRKQRQPRSANRESNPAIPRYLFFSTLAFRNYILELAFQKRISYRNFVHLTVERSLEEIHGRDHHQRR